MGGPGGRGPPQRGGVDHGKKTYFDKITASPKVLSEFLASSLRWAVEPVNGKSGKFKIVDQEHMADMWEMAQEFMEK